MTYLFFLQNKGYDFLVDYWSLGCILFEFLSGYPPFAAPSMEEVWINVYHWQQVLERPTYEAEDAEFNLSDTAWDLITKLISGRRERLGCLELVLGHPFFAELMARVDQRPDDYIIRQGAWEPPFVPQLSSELDTTYFDDFSHEAAAASAKPDAASSTVPPAESEYPVSGATGNAAGGAAPVNNTAPSEAPAEGDDAAAETPRSAFVGFTFRHRDARNWYNAAFDVGLGEGESRDSADPNGYGKYYAVTSP